MNSLIERVRGWWVETNRAAEKTPEKYTCGTLRYTPATLAVLFGWLLWGDFTMCLMESLPGLLVMQLKDHAISNQAIGFLMTTIFNLANTVLNPVISYSSDRYRSRWGRRRPFLLFATPFVTVFLLLIPWSPEITGALLKVGAVRSLLELLPFAPLVLVFGVLIALFQIFNMFICTVYYYLIPDTVPEPFIGRFFGWFRIVGLTGGMLFNWFVFGNAHAHMRLVFAVFSVIYGISFTLMCWKVREGGYPEIREEHGHWFSPIKNYARECFGNVRNWVIFLVYGAIMWPSAASQFSFFFYRDQIGLTETEFGRLATASQGAMFLLSAPFGSLVDRLGSQKSLMLGLIAGIVTSMACFFLIHSRLMAFVLGFTLNIPVFLIFLALAKWTVDMYPRSQYGQYGSAGAIVGAIGTALFTPLAGKLLDLFGNNYRLCWLGYPVFYTVSLVLSLILYRWTKPDEPAKETTSNGTP
jgi:Na+/melibiose symporter-like transporter